MASPHNHIMFFKLSPSNPSNMRCVSSASRDTHELVVTNEQAIAIDAGRALCVYDTATCSILRIFVEADTQTQKEQGAEMTTERILPILPMKRPVHISHCRLELEECVDGVSFGIDIFENARRYERILVPFEGTEPTKRVPLYAYIHGTITIMRSAICQWDSVLCGHMSVPTDTDSATIDSFVRQVNSYVQGDHFIVWVDADDDPEYDHGEVMFEGTQMECIDWCEMEDREYRISYD